MQLSRRYSFWELGLPFFSRDTPALFCMITWASVLWVSDVKEFCIILWSGEPSDGIEEKGIAAEYLSSTQTSDVKNKVNSIIRLLICRFA